MTDTQPPRHAIDTTVAGCMLLRDIVAQSPAIKSMRLLRGAAELEEHPALDIQEPEVVACMAGQDKAAAQREWLRSERCITDISEAAREAAKVAIHDAITKGLGSQLPMARSVLYRMAVQLGVED